MTTPTRLNTGFLMSYHYYKDVDLNVLAPRLAGHPLFLDSGAYSAMTVGAVINLTEFATYALREGHRFEVIANLDVINDPQASWDNWVALKKAGVNAQPVVHAFTPYKWLQKYIDAGEKYILLGGMVTSSPGTKTESRAWLVGAFRIAAKHDVVFHGFGLTNIKDLAEFPWYSCDSSSWGAAYRFGHLRLWSDRGGWVPAQVGDPKTVYKAARLLREHLVEPEFIADRTKYHHSLAARASAIAWHRMGTWWNRRHGPVLLPGAPPGPTLYLADLLPEKLATAAEAIRDYEAGRR